MQLSGPEILKRMNTPNPNNPDNKPNIIIEPFDERCLGSNSYDLHLSPKLKIYTKTLPRGMKPFIPYDPTQQYHMEDWFEDKFDYGCIYKMHPEAYDIRNPIRLIDPCQSNETTDLEIPETGAILNPLMGYLGSTVEYTETRNIFPYIDGKSSLGRNFVLNHHTAGRGDDGFCGNWTLEIHTLYPTVVYPYMRIGQIYYEDFIGQRKQYDTNKASHYNKQSGPTAAAPIAIDWFIKEKLQNQK